MAIHYVSVIYACQHGEQEKLRKWTTIQIQWGQTRKFTSVANVGKAGGNQVEALYDAK